MIIYTNKSNPSTLKLLICANLAKKYLEIKIASLEGIFDSCHYISFLLKIIFSFNR